MTAAKSPDWAALEAAVVGTSGTQCKVCRILSELPADGRAVVERLLSLPADKAGPHRLADGLNAMGYDVTKNSVMRHRANHMAASA